MVLRRPYAFLIKHFRLIHIVITALFGLVAYKSRSIYIFLKKVIADSASRYDAEMYINKGIILYIFLALILCFAVQWLLKYKDKPRKLYTIIMVIYVIISIFLLVLFNYMGTFASAIADQKTIRMYRDILTIMLLLQYYVVFVMLIRGLGFDLKKFDFNRDMQELNLNAEDSEEVEVNVGVDTSNVMRIARRQGREFGYFYKEFKVYILVILVVVIGILGIKGYKYFKEKYKVYAVGDTFGVKNIITIKDGYAVKSGGKYFVVINFDIYKHGKKALFNTGDMALLVNKNKYIPDKNICYKFNLLGNCYKKQNIINNAMNYILVYEVEELKNNQVYIVYNDYYERQYKVKLYLKEIEA